MAPIAAARRALGFAAATIALSLAAPACADTITVFAAASLKEPLDEVARAFEARSGERVRIAYAASSALARQIEAGAPANLFISADVDWVDYLEPRGRVVGQSRVNLLANDLVLVAPAASAVALRVAPGFPLAQALGAGRLALADPTAVPAGKYARAALERLGVWKSVEARIARADNVRAALAFVARGDAPLGIVYRTDAIAERGVRVVDAFPRDTHPPIIYPAVLVAPASPAARALHRFLLSPEARAIWGRHGFRPPA